MNTLDTERVYTHAALKYMNNDAASELHAAINKHPLFADRLTHHTRAFVDMMVETNTAINDGGNTSADSIFSEEYNEFLQAVQRGDMSAARKELAQCMCVLQRIGLHLEHYVNGAHAN